MKNKLNEVLKNAYGKYSDVQVASIVVDKSNNEYKGVNVENAAYPSSICAERNAIFNAVTNGVKPGDIKKIHLTSNLKDKIYPCGACLQVMLEFCPLDAKISIYFNDEVITHTLKELIPFGVTAKSFGWK